MFYDRSRLAENFVERILEASKITACISLEER
jgi:hypothetical protein